MSREAQWIWVDFADSGILSVMLWVMRCSFSTPVVLVCARMPWQISAGIYSVEHLQYPRNTCLNPCQHACSHLVYMELQDQYPNNKMVLLSISLTLCEAAGVHMLVYTCWCTHAGVYMLVYTWWYTHAGVHMMVYTCWCTHVPCI